MVRIQPKTNVLIPNNRLALETAIEVTDGDLPYADLLRVLADVQDMAAQGRDAWVTFGSTKDKSSLTMTVVLDGSRQTLYQVSLSDLAEASGTLL